MNTETNTQIDYDNSCPVCFDPMTSKATTQCGHQFCTSCLLQAFRQKSVCPCCRASLIPTEEGDDDDDSEYEDEDEDDESETFVEDAVPVAPLETVVQALQKEGFSYADLVSLLTERHAGGAAALDTLVDRVENIVEDLDVRTAQQQRQKTVLAQIPLVASVWGYREAPMTTEEEPVVAKEKPTTPGQLPTTIYELFRQFK